MIAVLAGGVGAARMLGGVVQVVPPAEVRAIVNTGDDLELYGLSISPDLDTVTYTLAGAVDQERGWGLSNESFQALDAIARYGEPSWFSLGDRDLATHLFRSTRLRAGATLTEVTAEIARAWGLELTLLPMSDQRVRTKLTLVGGEEIDFQEYFVHRRHDVEVSGVRFEGAEQAMPGPAVLETLEEADVILVAPSNPIVSLGPILALRGVREVLERRRSQVVAVSPIVGGKALKGPADRLLVELGEEASALGVARRLFGLVGTFVIDEADAYLAPAIDALGISVRVTDTVMQSPAVAAELARVAIDAGES